MSYSDDSGNENQDTSEDRSFMSDKDTAEKINNAIKHRRASSLTTGTNTRRRDSVHRRRSPTASSPPQSLAGDNIFSASHARRMVKSEREDSLRSVLSPRVAAVMKGTGPVPAARRSTMEPGVGTPKDAVRRWRPPLVHISAQPSPALR